MPMVLSLISPISFGVFLAYRYEVMVKYIENSLHSEPRRAGIVKNIRVNLELLGHPYSQILNILIHIPAV